VVNRIYEAKQCYECPKCFARYWSLNGDNDIDFAIWRDSHNAGNCESVKSAKKKITLPLTEFISSFRMGKIPGISIQNPDAKRNIIVEYNYYD
jgi:hypothetical protein